MNRIALLPSLALVLSLATGCPKEQDTGNATPVASPSPEAVATSAAAATATPDAAASPAATPEAKDVTAVKYRWGGGLSPFHHYELEIRGDQATFVVKPMRSDEKKVTETLSRDEVETLAKLIDETKFFAATESPRKARIMDIGEATITVWKDGKTHTVKESGTTMASAEIKPLRKWLDEKVRLYLEKSGAMRKPDPAK